MLKYILGFHSFLSAMCSVMDMGIARNRQKSLVALQRSGTRYHVHTYVRERVRKPTCQRQASASNLRVRLRRDRRLCLPCWRWRYCCCCGGDGRVLHSFVRPVNLLRTEEAQQQKQKLKSQPNFVLIMMEVHLDHGKPCAGATRHNSLGD